MELLILSIVPKSGSFAFACAMGYVSGISKCAKLALEIYKEVVNGKSIVLDHF